MPGRRRVAGRILERDTHLLGQEAGHGCDNNGLVLLVPGVVDKEILSEVDHLLQGILARRHGHQVVEKLGGAGEVFEHELLVAEGVEDVLGG